MPFRYSRGINLKLIVYPNGEFTKENIAEILRFALEMRRRVKEQLKKIGGMEFYDINFSYIDNETFNEDFVSVPERCGGKIIPEGLNKPGHLYTVGHGKTGQLGVFKLETEMISGTGKFEPTGLGSDRVTREGVLSAYKYLKVNSKNISGSISTAQKDYLMAIQDLNGVGSNQTFGLAAFVALCSAAIGKPVISSLAVLGDLTIGGTIVKAADLANTLQACLDAGATKVLLPISSAADIGSVPAEIIGKFSLIFYSSPEDAVFKALGVE